MRDSFTFSPHKSASVAPGNKPGFSICYVARPASSSSTLGKMADVSKDTLRKEITAILKNADLTKTSAKNVRKQLEEKLEVDLADQRKVVDELVMEVLKDKKGDKKKNDDSDEDGEEDGEEENGGGANDDDDEEDEESDSGKKKAPKRPAQKKKKDSESEEGSEDEDEEEYSPKKKAKASPKKGGARGKKKKGSDSDSDEDWAKKKKKAAGGGGGGAKKGKGGGYTKACTLSPELAKLVGQEQMPRHEVVKKIWSIIKERNLYDPKNKQFAICDNDLQKVFGVKRFRTFGMMKHLKDHFIS